MSKTPKPMISNSLPVVQRISIETPCPKNWDEMEGDVAKRFCGHCQKHVHNFAEMESEKVTELLNSGTSICAKICRRRDGSIVTKDRAGIRDLKISRRRWFERLAGLAASVAAVLMVGGCEKENEVNPEVTGVIAPPEPPVPLMGEAVVEEELGDVAFVPEDSIPKSNDEPPTMLLGKVYNPGSQK